MTPRVVFLVAVVVLAVACALSSVAEGQEACARDVRNPSEQCCGMAVYNVETCFCRNGIVVRRPRPHHRPRPACRDKKIYTFAVGASDPPHDLIDETTGQHTGLIVDIVRKACRMAGKTCVTVGNAECYNNKGQYSLALNSRWYDVCANFYHTVDRGRSYAFMGAYAQEPAAFIYANAGSSISSVSPATQTVGVHRVYWINGECLKRNNMQFKNVVIKNSFDELKLALDNGEIDVAFLLESKAGGYKKLGSKINCAKTGPAFMMRKDMVNDMRWFDRAVKKLVHSRDFKRMCREAVTKYGGGDPLCL